LQSEARLLEKHPMWATVVAPRWFFQLGGAQCGSAARADSASLPTPFGSNLLLPLAFERSNTFPRQLLLNLILQGKPVLFVPKGVSARQVTRQRPQIRHSCSKMRAGSVEAIMVSKP
jgi:hypothetical protein